MFILSILIRLAPGPRTVILIFIAQKAYFLKIFRIYKQAIFLLRRFVINFNPYPETDEF